MSKVTAKLAAWFFSAALAIIGWVSSPSVPKSSGWGEVMPWLITYWLPVLCFSASAALATIPITMWFMDRRHANALQGYIRENPATGFPDRDATDVLSHIREQSVWAWKQYARLNFWEMVDNPLTIAEFQRAASQGEILTLGWINGVGPAQRIDRRFWREWHADTTRSDHTGDLRLRWPAPPSGVDMSYGRIGVATADVERTWPRASVLRKVATTVWVWLKRQWYGLRNMASLIRAWRRENGI